MNIDEFTDIALKVSGLTSVKQRDDSKKKLDALETRLRRSFDELDFPLHETEFLHLWLWSNNQKRFPMHFSEEQVREYSSLPLIIEKDLERKDEHIGICSGLVSEYIILAERLGVNVKPIHLRGISDSHVYVRYGNTKSPVHINLVDIAGYNCDILSDAKRNSVTISREELLGLLLSNYSVADLHDKEYSRALRSIDKAASLYSSAPEIKFNKARANFKLGNLARARNLISELPKTCVNDPKVLFLQGEIEYEWGNHREAAEIFRDIASYWNDHSQNAIRYIGISLDRMGHESEAIYYLKQALDLNPEDGHARREFYKIMRKP